MRITLSIVLLAGLILAAGSPRAEDKIDFAKQIYPFIKSSCVKCHRPPYEDDRGRTRKPKGDIIFSSKEGILDAKDEDGNKVLVPGDPDKSRMLEVTKLPLDDDYHYPPEGKAPQWTNAEKELFAKWIKQGAEFGDWKEDPKPNEGLEWDGKERE